MNPFKPKIRRYESLPSTNNEVARLAALGADEGLAVIAEEQTAGRGRLQRTWISPKGAGLYFSILLRPQILVDRWPLITFIAALSVSDALLEACGLDTDIKWPNDLLAGERKICGILAEVIETSTGPWHCSGHRDQPDRGSLSARANERCDFRGDSTGRPADREAVLSALVNALSRWYVLLHESDGPEKVLADWISRSSYASGKLVNVLNGDDMVSGITRGLEADGALRLETETGLISLRAGDVVSVRSSGG
jgi:BirA family biotin operon repressor/biotin-[acetyl-CoA-carboxylase] ligase